MATKRKSKETPEQTLERWIAGSRPSCYHEIVDAGWEAGQVGYMELYGTHYEKFYFEDGSYAVVEWDDNGNISCCK